MAGPPVVAAAPVIRRGALVALGIAIVLSAQDMTVVAVALPVIGTELGASPGATGWVLLAYFLPMVALAVPAGRWLDRTQLRPAFGLVVAGFIGSSLLVAVAPTFWSLLAGRMVQGVFAAVVGVLGFPVVAAVVAPHRRARVMSVLMALIPLSAVTGPPLGGLVTELYGWRWVFAVNVPVGLLALWLGRRSLPSEPDGGPSLRWPDRRLVREAAVLGGGVAALLYALDRVAAGTGHGPLAAGLVLLAAGLVAVWSRLPESRPVVAFLTRPSGWALATLLAVTTGMGGIYFLVPYLFSELLQRGPRQAGLALLVMAAAMAAAAPVAGAVADRIGARSVILAGCGLALAGTVALVLLGDAPRPADVAWRLALVGAGSGLFAGPNAATILAAAPSGAAGAAGGVTALFRTLGLSFGPAVAALAWSLAGAGAGFQAGAAALAGVAAVGTALAVAGALVRRPEDSAFA